MKKVLLIFGCLFSAIAFGQTTKPTTFGIKGGLNMYNYWGNTVSGSDRTLNGTDFYVGLFADTQISEKWSIENELLYSYGHFIEVPIHLKYHFSNDKWSVFLGPKIDFAVDENPTSWYAYSNKTLGFSIDTGVSYNLTNQFFVEARYSFGLSEQIYLPNNNFIDGTRNTLRLGIGYKF